MISVYVDLSVSILKKNYALKMLQDLFEKAEIADRSIVVHRDIAYLWSIENSCIIIGYFRKRYLILLSDNEDSIKMCAWLSYFSGGEIFCWEKLQTMIPPAIISGAYYGCSEGHLVLLILIKPDFTVCCTGLTSILTVAVSDDSTGEHYICQFDIPSRTWKQFEITIPVYQ